MPFRYLLATLSANEGKMMNTVIIKSFSKILFRSELASFPAGDVTTNKIPMTPKVTEAPINILVAIFCIYLVYQF